ncbi:MAG: helix-turn-helix transcriptional regulator [Acidobacteriota bacterium]|nr:helix-turn-helix transcriptional regulator [Acidobacteriota bacterium]
MPVKAHKASDYLRSSEDAAAYLNAALEETRDDPRPLVKALRNVAEFEEDLADNQAALAVQARIDEGVEELVPEMVVNRLADGEASLRVWREYRGVSQAALARAASTSRARIVDIEARRRTGSVRTLRRLADALGIEADDFVSG